MPRARLALSLSLAILAAAAAAAGAQGMSMGAAGESAAPPLYDGLGPHHHAVTTRVPLAQKYFDQGLVLCYGFNHEEAIRAFRQAAELDPTCAMAHWGIAYALGPNINMPMDAAAEERAHAAIQHALTLAPQASAPERRYLEAMARRYGPPDAARRAARDSAYAEAMEALARDFARDADAQALYAEALLDLNPWNQWRHDGQPNPGTLEAVAAIERGLRLAPDHPGLIHFYIHSLEASPRFRRALPHAERLASLVPGAGHLVHMPSHLFRRVGRYNDAIEANRRAAAVDRAYLEQQKPQGIYPIMYYSHNLHFVAMNGAMAGRTADAYGAADVLEKHLPVERILQAPSAEYLGPVRLQLWTRFGRWSDILAAPEPPPSLRYMSGMWHYARGLALAAEGRLDEATAALDSLTAIRDAMPDDYQVSINRGDSVLTVAVHVLAGQLAGKRGDVEEAVRHLREGVRVEDGLRYDEPPTWYYPVRQTLAARLLAAGRAREAEAVYRDDLEHHPDNGWSLHGLAAALEAQGRGRDAQSARKRFAAAWEKADTGLSAVAP